MLLSVSTLCAALTFSEKLDRAATRALAQTAVKVHVTLAKPVYMSEVMFRPVRGGKDVVVRTDYKEQTCTGRLSAQKTHVAVPVSCVQNEQYKAEQITLTFADGRNIQKSAQAVRLHKQAAHIFL